MLLLEFATTVNTTGLETYCVLISDKIWEKNLIYKAFGGHKLKVAWDNFLSLFGYPSS